MAQIHGKQLRGLSIAAAKLANDAVETLKIKDGNVTLAKLNSDVKATDLTLGASTLSGMLAEAAAVISYVDSAQSAAQSYADSVAQGLDVKQSVHLATTDGDIDSLFSYSSGVLSESTPTQASLLVDQVAVALGDRILVKNRSTASENGIYTVTQVGDGISTAWELTRATDFDTDAEVTAGAFCFVEEGVANADAGFVLSTNGPITLDTTALEFTQFSGAGQVTAGDALTKTGNTLDVNVDNLAIEIDGLDRLTIKDAGVDENHLAATVAGEGLSGGAGSALSLDLSEVTAGTVALADHFAFTDVSASSVTRSASISSALDLAAGDGIASTSGVHSVDLATISGLEIVGGKLKVDAYSASTAFYASIAVTDSGLIAATQHVDTATASATSSDGDATGYAIDSQLNPAADTHFLVFVNGIAVDLTSDKLGDCYFSNDSGATALSLTAVQPSSTLHWNGSIAGYQLDTDDQIRVAFSVVKIPGGLSV